MRIYVAGPISGYDFEERKKAFAEATLKLQADGWEVVNPMLEQERHAENEVEYVGFLRGDLRKLVSCDGIYLLKGYANSRGAQLELHVAKEFGLREIYEDHPETILEEAERIVSGDRGPQYGHPAGNFVQTAKLWGAYKGVEFTPEDVAAFMVLLKMARQAHRPKRDNLVDVAGYVKTWDMVVGAREAGEI